MLKIFKMAVFVALMASFVGWTAIGVNAQEVKSKRAL